MTRHTKIATAAFASGVALGTLAGLLWLLWQNRPVELAGARTPW